MAPSSASHRPALAALLRGLVVVLACVLAGGASSSEWREFFARAVGVTPGAALVAVAVAFVGAFLFARGTGAL